jgi:pimeloyl-ACP methyl ester carboxylesterase
VTEAGDNTLLSCDEWLKAEAQRLLQGERVRHERGGVAVGGETVQYEMFVVDARPVRRGRPQGSVLVVVPGHGQTARGPKKLVATAALLSKSKIAWCIDPVPSRGGDRIEGMAIAEVTRQKLAALQGTVAEVPGALKSPARAMLIGWSHGGSEALRAAAHDPELFPQYLGLCPTGLVKRHPLELLSSFFWEALRTLGWGLRRWDWTCVGDTLRMGLNLLVGLSRDLWRSRSLCQLIEDVGWASRKVTGERFGYTGEVVLLFGRQDTVVRWQDVFPDCARPDSLVTCLPAFRRRNFPQAQRVEVGIVEGGHVAPETEAPSFLRRGLTLLGQVDEAVAGSG